MKISSLPTRAVVVGIIAVLTSPASGQANSLPRVCQISENCRGIIEESESPITVKSFAGQVRIKSTLPDDSLPGAVVEVFGPGNSNERHLMESDAKGNFRIRNLAPGTYVFHVGKMGFNSRIGTLIVSKDAHSKHVVFELSIAT